MSVMSLAARRPAGNEPKRSTNFSVGFASHIASSVVSVGGYPPWGKNICTLRKLRPKLLDVCAKVLITWVLSE